MNAAITDELRVETTLRSFASRRVYVDTLYGNNGDKLIELGSLRAIDQAGLKRVSRPEQADVIAVIGGAGLSGVWGGAYENVARYGRSPTAGKPLVILPSTLTFENASFVDSLRQRNGEVHLFARERASFDRAMDANLGPGVRIGIDHDMAFHLADSPLLKRLKTQSKAKQVLVVERRDAETLSGPTDAAVPAPTLLKQLTPRWVKRPFKRSIHKRSRSDTPFARWARAFIDEHYPAYNAFNFRFMDVSLNSLLSFEHFCVVISHASIVLTTRLHVGILAAMMEKPTIIVPGSVKYGKIQGIYDYSLHDYSNVQLVDNPFTDRESR